ncbi:hypothetical protein LQF76_01400 [Gloeomargaritales cyanobacterium VI4D9]|nr:hypothetical protein LQF76_01400 [Gloeomargaritales cyanobacterium VI4D9]
MTKKWVQISHSKARVVEEYNVIIFTISIGIGTLILGCILFALFNIFLVLLFNLLINLLIQFIQFNLLHGEPVPKTLIEQLPLILFCIIFIIIFMILWLFVPDDELIFDLDEGTLKYLVQSRFDKLLKRQGSIKKRLHLSEYSKVSLRVDSEVDSDNDRWYCYSLKINSDSPDIYFEIDCSARFSSTNELYKSSRQKLHELENLGRQLADFLQVPMVLDIDANKAAKTDRNSSNSSNARISTGSKDEIETAVEKIYKTLKSSFGNTHEYRIVNSEDFRGYVDLAYYHRLQSALVEQGYTWAGDIEDMTVAEELREYNSRTFIRIMINSTHNTSIAFYHVNPKIPLGHKC